MTDELTAFWSAIAQLIPVLAIPLVIEARTLARRISSNADEFKRRSLRVRWGLTYIVLGGAMASVEFTALACLAFRESLEWQVYYALVVMLLAFYVVFSIPVTAIGEAMTRDATWIMAIRAPWGKVKRGRRKARRLLAKVIRSRQTAERQMDQFRPMLDTISGRPDADQVLRGIHAQNVAKAQMRTSEGRQARRLIADTQLVFGPDTPPSVQALREFIEGAITVYDQHEKEAREFIARYDDMILRGAPKEAVEALRLQTSALGQAFPS